MRYKDLPAESRDKIDGYNKRLLPINIVVCVLALTAILTLYLAPLLSIDIGKIVAEPNVQAFIAESISEGMEGDDNDREPKNAAAPRADSGEGGNGGAFGDIDIANVVTPLIGTVLGSFSDKGLSLSISASQAQKVAFGSAENPITELVNEMMFDEGGLVPSIVGGIKDIFKNKETVKELQSAIISTVATAALDSFKNADDVPEEVKEALENLSDEDIEKVVTTLEKLDTVKSEADVKNVVRESVDVIEELMGDGQTLDEETVAEIENTVLEYYNATMEQIEGATDANGDPVEFSLETLVCVTLSSSDDFNIDEINKMIAEMLPGGGNVEPKNAIAPTIAPKSEAASAGGDTSGEPDADKKIVYSYSELVDEIDTDSLEAGLKATVEDSLGDIIEDSEEIAMYFGYAFYVILVFMGLWAILFLFAFFHIFAHNKRFCTWYVKLLCWIPAIIWLVITLLGNASFLNWITELVGMDLADMGLGSDPVAVITGAMSGITSYTWVCGLCYVLVWLISVFWAFPIKRKLRKEIKAARRG